MDKVVWYENSTKLICADGSECAKSYSQIAKETEKIMEDFNIKPGVAFKKTGDVVEIGL